MTDKTMEMDARKDEPMAFEGTERTRDRSVFVPRADIYETQDAIYVVVDVPGADEKSVELGLEKNILTISAYPPEQHPEGYSRVYSEYGVGDYERRFALSNEIDRENIEASVKNGVLSLRLPKAPQAKARKIAVKGA